MHKEKVVKHKIHTILVVNVLKKGSSSKRQMRQLSSMLAMKKLKNNENLKLKVSRFQSGM